MRASPHRSTLVSLAALAALAACGDRSGSAADASPRPDAPDRAPGDASSTDAAGGTDAAPDETAVVGLSIDDTAPAIDTNTTVTWTSTNATACEVTANNEPIATGTSGSADVLVDGLVRISASCQPFGRGSRAIVGVAPACEDTLEVDSLLVDSTGAYEGVDEVTIGATTCVDVAGMATLSDAVPALASRIRSAGSMFLMHAGSSGTDLVRLESTGFLGLDYQNGYFGSFFSYPVLTDVGGTITLAYGRVDLRAATEPALFITEVPTDSDDGLVLDLPPTLGAVTVTGIEAPVLPLLTTDGEGVTGDVAIRDNPNLSDDTIDAFLSALGPIDGSVIRCGNRDDDPCS